jgi:hypothetical protein
MMWKANNGGRNFLNAKPRWGRIKRRQDEAEYEGLYNSNISPLRDVRFKGTSSSHIYTFTSVYITTRENS